MNDSRKFKRNFHFNLFSKIVIARKRHFKITAIYRHCVFMAMKKRNGVFQIAMEIQLYTNYRGEIKKKRTWINF